MEIPERSLELLLSYNGKRYVLRSGYFLKFEVRRVAPSNRIPHGIAYSLTLHDETGRRILGHDNAHLVPHRGSKFVKAPEEADHWHNGARDEGRPYRFVSVERLLEDFYREVEQTLAKLGMSFDVVGDEEDGHEDSVL